MVKRTKSPDIDGPLRIQFWIPKPLEGLISRVRHGLFGMNRVFSSHAGGDFILSCPEGRRLVRIAIAPGQGVCFQMRNLVAFGAHVRISSYMNLSLAACGAGRAFVHMATCSEKDMSGGIVLETIGEPTFMRSQEASFDIHRMMAWDPRVEFRFGDLVGLADIVMTHPHVSVGSGTGQASVLLEADDSIGVSIVSKLVRAVASIFIPGL